MAEAAAPATNKDRLLSLGVHEFRTPVTVIAGYLRMLMTGRTGPLTDTQRKMLEEMERSMARLSGLIAEMSELSLLESGDATLNQGSVDIAALIDNAIPSLPPVSDREVHVRLDDQAPGARVHGDPVRLRTALTSLVIAHRRELVTCDELCVRIRRVRQNGRAMLQVAMAGSDRIDAVQDLAPGDLAAFEEFRGGVGFTLPIARWIVRAHGGELWSPAAKDARRAAMVMVLPEA
jgi:signal transduction histidine kinase